MALRLLLAAAAAALLAPAAGLAVHALAAPDSGALAQDNGLLGRRTRAIMSELVSASLKEPDPRINQQKELGMLQGLLSEWDAKNVSFPNGTKFDEMARRMAVFAFRTAIRNRLRDRNASQEQADADSKVMESMMKSWKEAANKASNDFDQASKGLVSDAMKSWIDETNRVAHDPAEGGLGEAAPKGWEEKEPQGPESETSNEESDPGEAAPPTEATPPMEEEKHMQRLERLEDLLDAYDSKNDSQTADLLAALAQAKSRPRRRVVPHSGQQREVPVREAEQENEHTERALADFLANMTDVQEKALHAELYKLEEIWKMYGPEHTPTKHIFEDVKKPDEGRGLEVVEATKGWTEEAKKASKVAKEAAAKEEEKEHMKRLEHLLDGYDPKNASQMDDLMAALAQARSRPRRKASVSTIGSAKKAANARTTQVEKVVQGSHKSDLSINVPLVSSANQTNKLNLRAPPSTSLSAAQLGRGTQAKQAVATHPTIAAACADCAQYAPAAGCYAGDCGGAYCWSPGEEVGDSGFSKCH